MKNKILSILAAILLCAQGAVAGLTGDDCLQRLQIALTLAGVCSGYYISLGGNGGDGDDGDGLEEENLGLTSNYGELAYAEDDDDSDEEMEDEECRSSRGIKNEEPEAAEMVDDGDGKDAEGDGIANSSLSKLEGLPPEMLMMIVEVGNLSDQDLAALCQSSKKMHDLFSEELQVRKTLAQLKKGELDADVIIEAFYASKSISKKVHADFIDGLLAVLMENKMPVTIRLAIVKAIGALLASDTLDALERAQLLAALVGGNGHDGLLGDQESLVRGDVAEAVGDILASGKPNAEERTRLLDALVGADGHGGLLEDQYPMVRWVVAKTIGDILASDTLDAGERTQLLGALIGGNGHGGLSGDQEWMVRVGVAGATGVILASGTSDTGERTQLLGVLIGEDGHGGLRGDPHDLVQMAVAEAIEAILASGALDEKEFRL